MTAVRWARTAVVATLLVAVGGARAQTCTADPGGRDALAWNGPGCVEGVTDVDRAQRTFVVSLPAADDAYRLVASAVGGAALELCLDLSEGSQCRSAEGSVTLSDLVLAGGEVRIRLALRAPAGTAYRVAFERHGSVRPGHEREPNDDVGTATALGADLTVRGRLTGREQDYFRVVVTGEPQLWLVQVVGEGVTRLRLHDASGRTVQQRDAEAGERGIRLSNLFLLPGPHWFSVDGADADYALRLLPLGPPDEPPPGADGTHEVSPLGSALQVEPSAASAEVPLAPPSAVPPPGRMEREPNDDPSRAHPLRPGEPWVGLLSERGDRDVYRFHLAEEGHVRFTLVAPADGAVEADLRGRFSGPGVGETYVYQGWFLAGDHVVTLRPAVVGDGHYQVWVDLLDPFDLPDDLEPNDAPHQARAIAADLQARGTVGEHGDADHFLLPSLAAAAELTIELEGVGPGIGAIRDPGTGDRVASPARDRERGVWHATLPAGGPYALEVNGSGAYVLRLWFGPGGPAPVPRGAPPPVEMRVRGGVVAAAYLTAGQRWPLEVEMRNTGRDVLTLDLEVHVSDHGWRATPAVDRVTLAGGEARLVPLPLSVAPGARDDLGVTVTVAARAADGGLVTAALELAAVCGAPPVGTFPAWPLPDPLLGGLDVAWTGLGSVPQTAVRRELLLYDGRTQPGDGWNANLGDATIVSLAGGTPPRVVGVVLHPLADGTVGERLADFRVSTSLDGIAFETAFEGRMRSVPTEQAFVFETPRDARFVRLEALSRQDGGRRGAVRLGALKVVAEPGSAPLGGPLDLARRAVGGHVAHARPHVTAYALTESRDRPTTVRLDRDETTLYWVLGFHHGRAALVDALAWIHHPAGDPGARLREVRVLASLSGPIGPWTEVGMWRPHEHPEWTLDGGVWARYLRFEAEGLEPRGAVELPERVAVVERREGPGYRSILGEWGHDARASVYEWLQPADPDARAFVFGNVERGAAAVLVDGEAREGRVLVNEAEAWFAFDVPHDRNFVRLELRGDPAVAFRHRLLDAAGEPVTAAIEVREGEELVEIEAYLTPGRYHLQTWEPLRSVAFSWDNSGSMGPYLDPVYQAIASFARGVDPAREAVQLQVFGDPPRFLLADWSSDPEEVVATLTAYDRRDGSSDAEGNLAFVVERLGDRAGTRAVLLMTDAESGAAARQTVRLWEALEVVRPRVFAFETSTAGSDHTQDRLQAWADAAGGAYDHGGTIGDLDVGLARVACWLRQPKRVHAILRLEDRPPPGPGALAILRYADPAAAAAERPAIAVILDASGSMGKLLPDGRTSRWEAARGVIDRLVGEVLEDGVPFALRAYGHVLPTSCDTRLEVPLGPLDRAVAREAVAAIEPKLLSGTPLAASVEALAVDLAGAAGRKAILIVTDGEESCGGDPEAAIRALRAVGADVRLSIVGFDVDAADGAAARGRFAAWADLGGGHYHEARDADALTAAVVAALAPPALPFAVWDAAGGLVAEGEVDGPAVTLPSGVYRVRIGDEDGRSIDGVIVRSEEETRITLDALP